MAMIAERDPQSRVHTVTTRREGRALHDRAARHYLGMSGEEFIKAWEAGEFDDDPDRPGVMNVAMLLPFAR